MRFFLSIFLLALLFTQCKTVKVITPPDHMQLTDRDTLYWNDYTIAVNPIYWYNAMPSASDIDTFPRIHFYLQFSEINGKDIQSILRVDSMRISGPNGEWRQALSHRDYSSGNIIETNTLSLKENLPAVSSSNPLKIYVTKLSDRKPHTILIESLQSTVAY